MKLRTLLVGLALIALGCAEAQHAGNEDRKRAEREQAAGVRITSHPDAVRGCTSLGIVTDDDFKDMQKKVAGMGGNTAYLMTQQTRHDIWFGIDHRTEHTAEVYRCGRQ